MTEGIWETPLGAVKIDSDLAAKLLKNSKHLESDTLAHADEHSLEVELPILQYFKPDFEIVPIAFMTDDVEALKKTGAQIAGVLKEPQIKDSVMMVASSDMTHYEPHDIAWKKDNEAIKAIVNLDEDALMERIRKQNISMCGYAPVVVMLSAAKSLGAKGAKLVKYETSGDVTGDKDSVVGYAGITIY
jgi:AmmeMemoRadiSam system protein B